MIVKKSIKLMVLAFLATSLISCLLYNDIELEWLTYEEYPYTLTTLAPEFELVETRRIWGKGGHNAFTDIISFKEYIYIVFREASCCHRSFDGKVRVIRSVDLKEWESVAELEVQDKDVRDPKLSICPSNTLCINATARNSERLPHIGYTHQSYVWNSRDGENWSDAHPVLNENYWLWRVRWDSDAKQAYGFSYRTGVPNYINLHTTQNGLDFNTKKYKAFNADRPTETDLVFLNDSTVISLVRRSPNSNSIIGLSRSPFMEWRWEELNEKIGSPNLLLLPDNRIVAGTRYLEPEARTSVSLIDPVEKKITEVLQLPSGGDNGYPGMILIDDELIISYYSSHQQRTSIYLARVKLNLGLE